MKPEYAHWDRQPEYVLTDAAQLCCDHEPQPWARGTISPKVEAMARRIQAELKACRDTSITFYSPGYGGGARLPIRAPGDQYYQRADLREWAERMGQRAAMPFLFPEDRTESEIADKPDPSEWGFAHDTKLLREVRWVTTAYWEGKDPKEGPTKELVVEKLQALRGLSKNEAEAVDLVTRPDSRRRSAP